MNFVKTQFKKFNDKRRLKQLDASTIDVFSFKGLERQSRVVKVYDGDTITILFRFNKQYYKTSCRILGIDTPELRTKNLKEKAAGYKARDFLSGFILDKIILIKFGKFDKYGRPLIEGFLDNGQSISNLMISNGHAKPYFGGKKTEWKF